MKLELTAVIAVFALVVSIWSVVSQRFITRRQKTIETIFDIVNSSETIKARSKLHEIANSDNGLLPYAEPNPEDANGATAISHVLNSYEILFVAIKHGVIDFKIFESYASNSVLKDWETTLGYIHRLRTTTNNPKIYSQFETLVEWIKK